MNRRQCLSAQVRFSVHFVLTDIWRYGSSSRAQPRQKQHRMWTVSICRVKLGFQWPCLSTATVDLSGSVKGRLLMLPGWCGSKKSSRLKKYASCCAMHTRYRRLYSGYTSATQAFSPELPESEVTVTTSRAIYKLSRSSQCPEKALLGPSSCWKCLLVLSWIYKDTMLNVILNTLDKYKKWNGRELGPSPATELKLREGSLTALAHLACRPAAPAAAASCWRGTWGWGRGTRGSTWTRGTWHGLDTRAPHLYTAIHTGSARLMVVTKLS